MATFTWIVLSTNDQGKFTLKNSSGLMQTIANTTQFNLPRLDALTEVKDGQKFQVKAIATPHKGRFQEQALYTFIVNAPPKVEVQSENTGCQVTPREGFAIMTNFHITCLGWYDKDVPLSYAFKYTFSSSTILIQKGNVGNVTSKLPVGDPDKGYERILELQIIDAYGDFTSVFVKTKVK